MDAGDVLLLGVVGVGGFLGYQEVVKPYLEQRQIEAQARAVAAQTGISYQDALSAVSTAACLGAVKVKGGPVDSPLVQQGCKFAGTVAALAILKGGPLAYRGAKYAVTEAVDVGRRAASTAGSAASAVGSGIATGAKAVGSGASTVAHGAVSVVKKVIPFLGVDGLLGYAA